MITGNAAGEDAVFIEGDDELTKVGGDIGSHIEGKHNLAVQTGGGGIHGNGASPPGVSGFQRGIGGQPSANAQRYQDDDYKNQGAYLRALD